MKLKLVSFELAKKLKEIGFLEIDEGRFYSVNGNLQAGKIGIMDFLIKKGKFGGVIAPTLEFAKMWFRGKHNLDIMSMPFMLGASKFYSFLVFDHPELDFGSQDYNSYEEALEAGLLKACDFIKNKKDE